MEKYLLGQIDGTDYGTTTDTPQEKMQFVFDCFTKEYECEYAKRRTPNYQQRVGEWLSGLPTCINIPCYAYDILELAKERQEIKGDTKEKWEEAVLKNYFNFMAYHLIKLHNKYSNSLYSSEYNQTEQIKPTKMTTSTTTKKEKVLTEIFNSDYQGILDNTVTEYFDKYKQNLRRKGNNIFSYDTRVAIIKGNELFEMGWWSVTTQKHINYAAKELGLELVKHEKESKIYFHKNIMGGIK